MGQAESAMHGTEMGAIAGSCVVAMVFMAWGCAQKKSASSAGHVHGHGHGEHHEHHGYRETTLHFMHQSWVHKMLTFFLLLDVSLVICSIALEIEYLHSKYDDCADKIRFCNATPGSANCVVERYFGHYPYYNAKIWTAYFSVSILFTFLIENLILLSCMGMDFIRSFWNMLDMFVVIMSIWLEIKFMRQPEGGLLILARCWRFVRIGHGLYETVVDHEKEQIDQYLLQYQGQISAACDRIRNVHSSRRLASGSNLKLVRSYSDASSQLSMDTQLQDDIWKALHSAHQQDPTMLPTVLLMVNELLRKEVEEGGLHGHRFEGRSESQALRISLLGEGSAAAESSAEVAGAGHNQDAALA